MKNIIPVGPHGGLDDYHRPAIGMRIDAEEKAGVAVAPPVYLPREIVRRIRRKEIGVARSSRIGWKRHAQPLVDVIKIPQPEPSGLGRSGFSPISIKRRDRYIVIPPPRQLDAGDGSPTTGTR